MDYRLIAILIASGLLGGIAFNWPSDADSKAQDAEERSEVQIGNDQSRGFSLASQPEDRVAVNPQDRASLDNASGRSSSSETVQRVFTSPNASTPQSTAQQYVAAEVPISNATVGSAPSSGSTPSSGSAEELAILQRDAEPQWSLETSSVDQGDRLLMGGNAVGAYQAYRHLSQREGAADPALNLRMALSAEMAALWETAEEHYRIVLRNSDTRSVMQVQSLLGLARVWQAQSRLDVASQLLSEVALRFGTEQVPSEIRLATYHLLGECFQEQWFRGIAPISEPRGSIAGANAGVRSMRESQSADSSQSIQGVDSLYYWPPRRIEEILASIEYANIQTASFEQGSMPSSETGDQAVPAAGPYLRLIQKPSPDVHLILVDAKSNSWSVGQVLSEFARLSELVLEVSSQARAALSGRVLTVSLQSHPGALLLDQTLTPYDLVWLQEENRIQIASRSEVESSTLQAFDEARIHRTLQHIQTSFAASVERIAAYMHDGNLFLRNGKFDEAANRYRAAREMQPQGELAAKLFYNQGLVELALGQPENSLDLFYNALDQTLLPGMQSLAYGRIATMELAMGRPQKAVPAATRGLRLASGSSDAIANLLVLAKSYILDDDPYSANRVLFENKDMLQGARDRRIAALLSSYARYKVVKPMGGLQREGERLVVSLAAIREADADDFLDALLISRAFHDVGISTRSRDFLAKSVEMAPEGYWSERVRLELVKMMRDSTEYADALALLNETLPSQDPLLRIDTLMVKADLLSHLEKWGDCRSACEQVLGENLDQDQKKVALSMLGRAHQKLGKHYAAALCFAGFLPRDDSTSLQNRDAQVGGDQ